MNPIPLNTHLPSHTHTTNLYDDVQSYGEYVRWIVKVIYEEVSKLVLRSERKMV